MTKIVFRDGEAQKIWSEIATGKSKGYLVDIGPGCWAVFNPAEEAAESPLFWDDENNPGEFAFAVEQGDTEIDVRYIGKAENRTHWVQLPCGVAVRVYEDNLLRDTKKCSETSFNCCCTPRLVEAAERFAESCRLKAERIIEIGEDKPYDQPLVTASGIINDAINWGPDEDGEYVNCWPLTENLNSRPFGCRFTRAGGLTVLDVLD